MKVFLVVEQVPVGSTGEFVDNGPFKVAAESEKAVRKDHPRIVSIEEVEPHHSIGTSMYPSQLPAFVIGRRTISNDLIDELTDAEMAIMNLLREEPGLGNLTISKRLWKVPDRHHPGEYHDMSDRTVDVHMSNLMRKFGAINRTELIALLYLLDLCLE